MYVICVEIKHRKATLRTHEFTILCSKVFEDSHLTRGDVEGSEMGLRQPVDQLGISFLTTDTVIMKFSAKVKVL